MPSISVIVPVYQAERSLASCVESVRAQTFPDWELLLIDDGSSDGSAALCDRFAASDDRIRAFHQPANRGVSEARNLGLREVRSEAIAFLDADDQLEPQALETLWCLREQAGADTAACAHWNCAPNGAATVEKVLPGGVYDHPQILERIVYPLVGDRLESPIFNGFIWRYLFSASLAEGIAFEGAYLEDELFLLEYFCKARRLAVTEQPLYRYSLGPNSATRRYMTGLQQTLRRFMERKEELVRRYGLEEARPLWREESNWAGLLIAVGNEYARGSPKTMRQRRRAVESLCAQPEMAHAIRTLTPANMSRNKQIVAALIRSRRFFLLTMLYRLKNRL